MHKISSFLDKPQGLDSAMAQDSASDLERRLALAEHQLSEALERQAATDEVLRVIAGSTEELEPVFQAILANATRICEAKFGILLRYRNGVLQPMATLGVPAALAEYLSKMEHSCHLQEPPLLEWLVRERQSTLFIFRKSTLRIRLPDSAARDRTLRCPC